MLHFCAYIADIQTIFLNNATLQAWPQLLTTIVNRPYVFAFLLAYLFLSIKRWGWKRSLVWLVSGYFIAWLSEYSSIHINFPYGEYHYIYENLQGELLVAGVPFFDSLSYPFLIFAGYTTAEFMLRWTRDERRGTKFGVASIVHRLSSVVLGALLTMLLDVIIDPIATMGDKWFLGKIHFYAHPGWYFGVPMTNFGGWFLVSLAVILLNVLMWKISTKFLGVDLTTSRSHDLTITYPLFYISIAIFNIVITFLAGEWKLGLTSSAILSAIITIIVRAQSRTIYISRLRLKNKCHARVSECS